MIEQLETELAPMPRPLQHGFDRETAYLVLGAFSLSESGEAFLVLSNNENEIWFISNRHLRTYELQPDSAAFRIPLRRDNVNRGVNAQNGHAASRPKTRAS